MHEYECTAQHELHWIRWFYNVLINSKAQNKGHEYYLRWFHSVFILAIVKKIHLCCSSSYTAEHRTLLQCKGNQLIHSRIRNTGHYCNARWVHTVLIHSRTRDTTEDTTIMQGVINVMGWLEGHSDTAQSDDNNIQSNYTIYFTYAKITSKGMSKKYHFFYSFPYHC